MRILFFSTEYPHAGDPLKATFNRRMCEALAHAHDVRVISPVPWTERLHRPRASLPSSNVPAVYPIFIYPPRVLASRRDLFLRWSIRTRVRRWLRDWRPDVVVGYWVHPDGEVGLRLSESFGVPFVQIVGGSDVLLGESNPRRWARIIQTLRNADEVVTVGTHLARRIASLGVRPDRLTSMIRPVSARFRPGSRDQARSRLRIPRDVRMVLWVGRFVPVKGVEVLINAFAAVHATDPKARLYLVGDGPLMGDMRGLAGAMGMSHALEFVGAVGADDLPSWYQAADVTALTSLSEGVPNVLLESIACGTPFVASEVGSIADIATGCDRLVPAGDAAALQSALSDVLREKQLPSGLARFPAVVRSYDALDRIVRRAARNRMAHAS